MMLKLWANPKNRAAPSAPIGCHFPNTSAARAIKPCPEMVECVKSSAIVEAYTPPPRPPKQSADHHADVAHFIYVDSHRIGRHRMLADRTDTKAERRFEQDKPGNKGKCYCKNRRIIDIRKEDLSQDGNIAQTGIFVL
ncbi:Uncharacterised protein [Bacillus subtilis]|nr:Uncharacterised protein [Bacillus subtilis]